MIDLISLVNNQIASKQVEEIGWFLHLRNCDLIEIFFTHANDSFHLHSNKINGFEKCLLDSLLILLRRQIASHLLQNFFLPNRFDIFSPFHYPDFKQPKKKPPQNEFPPAIDKEPQIISPLRTAYL